MIHKIQPHRYYPEFRPQVPTEEDYLLIFEENRVYLPKSKQDTLMIPTCAQAYHLLGIHFTLSRFMLDMEYLFSIDEHAFYRMNAGECDINIRQEECYTPNIFRTFEPQHLAFAGITASQINRFRLERKFCGKCGAKMEPSPVERAQVCPSCGMIEYPKISPAVITAIIHGDKILLTKYAGGSYHNWALVAGFVEVGETFKAAVRREVQEEVGLSVKNITYYKSQPWSFSDSAMIGFFAELDGEDSICLQEDELSTAKWFSREEIPEFPQDISIAQEMIQFFKDSSNPFQDLLKV